MDNIAEEAELQQTPWKPCSSDRVCSDGIPSEQNPNPTLKLGYKKISVPTPRKPPKLREFSEKKPTSTPVSENSILISPPMSPLLSSSSRFVLPSSSSTTTTSAQPPCVPLPPSSSVSASSSSFHHSYCKVNPSPDCHNCSAKDKIILQYIKQHLSEVRRLKSRIKTLQLNIIKSKEHSKPFSFKFIKKDSKLNFYTGITSFELFDALFNLLKPHFPKMNYWQGSRKLIRYKSKVRSAYKKTTRPRKLEPKDEFLLTLMRIRLGILNEDLADRFGIAPSTCSSIFKTWIRFLSDTLGKALVQWLPKESIMENMPKAFKKAGYGNVRVVIDCSEVFIERSKSLKTQAETWSDYKSHNTVKFLVGISPTGFITFLSSCYGGRASDRFICQDSNFYDGLDLYDEVMQIDCSSRRQS